MTFGICFKQHFDTRYLVFYNPSYPRMFLSLDLLSEYRFQHGAIGPIYVTSRYSTRIFCRGVSRFATDCPCGVWCRGLTNHLHPACWSTFWKSIFKQQLGCKFDIMDSKSSSFLHFDICNYICLDRSYHFLALSLLLKYSLFFSSTPVLTCSIDVVFIFSIDS